MLEQERLSEAVAIFREALEACPNEAVIHKGFVNALVAQAGMDEAFKHYELVRKDTKAIDIEPQDILCCVVARNEILRLPYFLSYYRKKGIGKFLVVDNDSTDNSLSYMLDQPDIYVWHSSYSFSKANFGAGWFELLLRKYGIGHWCLIADADELLYYPECENRSIIELCQDLDRKKKRAFNAVLLDMYSDKPVKATRYKPGQDFLEVCPYFDRQFYHTKYENGGPYRNQTRYLGGVRERIFGRSGGYYLSKVPLLKYHSDFILAGGQHWTNCPETEIATESGCLLHFKYFSCFRNYVWQQVRRKEHYDNAMQYKEYAQGLSQNEALTFYDKKHSIKLQGSRQLVQLGIMQSDCSEGSLSEAIEIEFPKIHPVSANVQRPFWSVMITTYDRVKFLERALRSVIEQAPGTEEMQIEVVNDGAPQSIQDEIERVVNAVAGSRVNFYRHPNNVAHPEIFNICIRRARGHWVHILHDDDWAKPGFYDTLRAGIEAEPSIGAAFCRQIHTHEIGHKRSMSWLERETSGIIEDWLERIAVVCRLQPPAIVVRRDAYEKLGGYCHQAKSAFDWEMWKRIAVYYPVWYEPRPLVYFYRHNASESSHLIQSGEQIADTLKAIEISQSYLPGTVSAKLTRRAREYYANCALDIAKRQLELGDYQAMFANIREGLKCSQSEQVKRRLVSILLQS
jgi:glycosyltransferase involved in cell wall biosynthesis